MTYEKTKCRLSENHPEVMDILLDVAEFSSRNKPSKIAKAVGISKQAINEKISKKKGKKS